MVTWILIFRRTQDNSEEEIKEKYSKFRFCRNFTKEIQIVEHKSCKNYAK
jgi:hypothetical protein